MGFLILQHGWNKHHVQNWESVVLSLVPASPPKTGWSGIQKGWCLQRYGGNRECHLDDSSCKHNFYSWGKCVCSKHIWLQISTLSFSALDWVEKFISFHLSYRKRSWTTQRAKQCKTFLESLRNVEKNLKSFALKENLPVLQMGQHWSGSYSGSTHSVWGQAATLHNTSPLGSHRHFSHGDIWNSQNKSSQM